MKLLTLAASFAAGAIGVTLLGWVLSLTPSFLKTSIVLLGLVLVFYIFLWGVDGPACRFLQISIANYYALLIAGGVAFLAGIIVLVGVLHA